jgi:hypothetical protein
MKNASSETYAQKTHALLNLVEEMIEFIEDADEEENDTKGQDSQNQDVPKNDDLQNQELNNKE